METSRTLTTRGRWRALAVALLAASAPAVARADAPPAVATAATTTATCPGYSKCPAVNYKRVLGADGDAIHLAMAVDATEAVALQASEAATLTQALLPRTLGKLLMFDRTLSVNGNQACASCHTPGAGFSGGIANLNRTVISFPGSVITRTGNRRPMSAAYAALAPVLHYDNTISDIVGGNFWDMRATGKVTGSAAGDQALGPPTNPAEMALPDRACAVYRVAIGHYAAFFRRVWGAAALTIKWPANTAAICNTPNTGAANQTPVALSAADRTTATAAYYNIGRAIAAFEQSGEVSPFSSKFDAFLNGKTTLTAQESLGLQLFRNQGHCEQCHISTGKKPLFTNFTASNIGVPANPANPFFYENKPDPQHFVANPAGPAYVDQGVGGVDLSAVIDDWVDLAPSFLGKFQVPTLRNAAELPRPGFSHSYMHNGIFDTLATVVHFYNTRTMLPACPALANGVVARVGVNCWPLPAVAVNVERHEVGNLQLSAPQEAAIVAFLGTLTDGYVIPPAK